MAFFTKKLQNVKRVVAIVLLITSFISASFAQSKEQIVILWDVTGSLLPKDAGSKDLDGSAIPTYSNGNGLWRPLKEAIIECIEYVEEDPANEIIIVTFNDDIRNVECQKATDEGKQSLKDFVRNYKYKSHHHTNLINPIEKFYSLVGKDKDKISYMFLFTDGKHDIGATIPNFIKTLNSWKNKTEGQNAYGFYVLVDPTADKEYIRKSVESQANFWMVKDAKVRIKICSFPSTIKYNIRDQKEPKSISLKGKFAGAAGKVQLVAKDQFYDVECSDVDISNGKLNIRVSPKSGANPPASHDVVLTPLLTGADDYTFVGPNEISLVVSNLPERSLNLTIDDSNLGKASYYGSFLFSKEKSIPVVSTIKVSFSEQARIENSSAIMKVYLVDKKSGEKISPASQNLTININGKGDSFNLTPDVSSVTLSISGQSVTRSGSYYGRIELTPTKLDNFSINGIQDVFKWKMRFSQKCNPLKLGLLWFLGIIVAAFFLWLFFLKPIFYPKFGSIQKVFNIPGMAPLIIRFKGSRMVVVAAGHPKKQSNWNRLWTGRIQYKTHPAFTSPIIFKPSRGRRILARVQAGTYNVLPNPMPGIGAAVITDVRTNLRINVN